MRLRHLASGASFFAICLAGAAPVWCQSGSARDESPVAGTSRPEGQRSNDPTSPVSGSTALANSGQESAALGDIVVTARKTSENLQRAPASIVAVSGAVLVEQSITTPLQLEKVLPSVNLHEEGAVTQTFIRGVGSRTDTPNFAAASTFLFNGIVIPRYGTTGMLFDLGSVQSIAGPQGTLYGGTAAGGAVNLNSATPSSDFAGSAVLEGGNYNAAHVAIAQDIAISDKLSLRGAMDYSRHEGFYTNGLDSQDRFGGRISAKFKPNDDLSVLVFFNGAREVGEPNAALVSNPPSGDAWSLPAFGPRGNPIVKEASFQDNLAYVAGANIDLHLGENAFTFIPGYVHIADHYREFIGGYNLLNVDDEEDQHSEELRWNRSFGRLKATLGVFYLDDRTVFGDDFGLAALPVTPFYLFFPINRTRQTNRSYAFFGQAVYSVTDRLRATVGSRYTNDYISASGLGGSGPFEFHRSRGHVDWKIGADYDLADRVLVYANIQTGYIPFGYNPDVTPSALVPTSRLLAFSGGFKSRFLDNRLEVNDEAFYYDYRHFQAIDFVSLTGLSTVLNADKGTIFGNDLSVRALLSSRTQFDLSVVLLHTEFNQFSGVGYNFTGNRFADAPTANIIAGLQHRVPLGSGSLLGRVSTHYESGHYGEFTNNPGTRQRPYAKTDLSLTYAADDDRWTIQAFVNNVENAAVFGTIATLDSPLRAAGPLAPPRTYGVRVSTSWK